MLASHCRRDCTTHNLCTPSRDAAIMKESRSELINSRETGGGEARKGERRSRLELNLHLIRFAREHFPFFRLIYSFHLSFFLFSFFFFCE